MARHPRSWLHNTLNVWLGYLLTAIAAIPASALGLFLIGKGMGQQTAILISISLAVLGGFVAERLITLRLRQQRRVIVTVSVPAQIAYQYSWITPTVAAAGFVLVVTGVPARPTGVTLPSAPAVATSASLLVRAR